MKNFKKKLLMFFYICLKERKNIYTIFLSIFGVGMTIYELLGEKFLLWFPNIKFPLFINIILNNIFYYFIIIVIVSIVYICIHYFYVTEYEIKIDNEHSVVLAIDDFFENVERYKKANCVFGANDAFNCDINKLTHNSIHYNFIKRYFTDKLNEHQLIVNESLINRYSPSDGEIEDESNRHFKHGTIATVTFDRKIDVSTNAEESRQAFMVANSRLRSNDKSYKMIDSTINYPQKVFEYIDKNGTFSDELIFPLIGTSVNTGQVSKNTVILQIINAFFDNIDKGDVKRLIISIPIDEYLDKKVDVIMLREYINSKKYIYKVNY